MSLGEREPIRMPDAKLAQLGAELDWLEVRSPDFRLYRSVTSGRAEPVYRALIGVTRGQSAENSAELRLVLLNEDVDRTIVLESAMLVDVRDWIAVDSYRLPQTTRIHYVDPEASPWKFARRAAVDLFLMEDGRVNPELAPTHFKP